MKKCFVLFVAMAFAASGFAADFKTTDKDSDGKISKEEFAGKKKGLQKKFDKLDKNKDGSLCEEEFKASMKKKKKKDDK
ncbi:MAG: hypothetical protein NE327_15170 [Lentisphaeraceae bacterium]|nr:hypothetical protein [Lentisphaeraceae bacterium]